MSLLDSLRATLTELPITDIVRARLELALDRLAEAEAKVEVLRTENADLKAALQQARLDHQQCQQEHQQLKDKHAEEVRVHKGLQFRRGVRTGGNWQAFCPVCDAPMDTSHGLARCPNTRCQTQLLLADKQIAQMIAELP